MSSSSTTIELLPPIHPGEIIRTEFFEPLGVPADALAARLGIDAHVFTTFLAGHRPVDAGLDLRLGRYFGMSEGFFLGLQADYDVDVWRRQHGDELAQIVPRAA